LRDKRVFGAKSLVQFELESCGFLERGDGLWYDAKILEETPGS
jgi:hypothetical protein